MSEKPPANLGSQVAMHGGLSKDLAARIDAIEGGSQDPSRKAFDAAFHVGRRDAFYDIRRSIIDWEQPMVPRLCECHSGQVRPAQEWDEYRAALLERLDEIEDPVRIGGALVTAQRAPSVSIITPNEAARVARRLEANRMSRAAARPRCGQPVMGKGTWNTPSGELCARNPGHRARDGHASAETMRAHAMRRRGRQGVGA